MFSFLKHSNKNKSFAVFCIDSASVTLTVIEKTLDSKQRILYVTRVSIDMPDQIDMDKILRNLKVSIDKILNGSKKNNLTNLIKPDTEIIILVGSPWHIGWGDTVKVEKDKAFRVTQELIDESIKESFNHTHPDLSITNINLMSMRLNGYEMKKVVGMKTKSLELKVYLSTGPKIFVDTVRAVIEREFPHTKIEFCSYNIAVYDAIYNTMKKKDCLMVIPEIETTTLILIKSGVLQNEASVPFGATKLARTLFGAKSSGIKESLIKTRRFVEGNLDIPEIDTVKTQLNAAKDNFLDQFRDVVWKMSDTLVLPSDIFVVGRNLSTHFVYEWLNSDEYIKHTFTIDDFKVSNLRGSDIISDPKFNGMFHHKSVPLAVALSTQIVASK